MFIIYTRAEDGGLTVLTPVRNTAPVLEDISDFEMIARAVGDVPKDATNVQIISAVPPDRTFRNAWIAGNGVIEHDMVKAREIAKDMIRAQRAPLFVKNDLLIQDALLSGNEADKAKAVATRDTLRNSTADPSIAAAQTPEELKAVLPAILGAKT